MTTTDHETCLERYAELLVTHGVNVQPGQWLNIGAEPIHRDFALRVAQKAYERGARFVSVQLDDPRLSRLRMEHSQREDDLEFVPGYVTHKYRELVDEACANLRIIGMEDPDVLVGVDAKKLNRARVARYQAMKYFYDEGIGKSRVHWTVAAAATPAWANKLFPDLDAEAATAKLWEAIFQVTRADQDDCLAQWDAHNQTLHRRAKALTELGVAELRFTGPGTDLVVGLSEKAVFRGGGDIGPREVMFEPNIPTEEVFTTPDYRLTRGKVATTRPFLINGTMVEGLTVEFGEGGEISSFSAQGGEEVFREYIASDEGASRLGEVALVGVDSPVYQSGVVFREILFDENAACHIAVGSAYKFCLDGGESMGEDELKALGCNESSAHTDMMISSEAVDVTAKTHAGDEVPLIAKGRWVEAYA